MKSEKKMPWLMMSGQEKMTRWWGALGRHTEHWFTPRQAEPLSNSSQGVSGRAAAVIGGMGKCLISWSAGCVHNRSCESPADHSWGFSSIASAAATTAALPSSELCALVCKSCPFMTPFQLLSPPLFTLENNLILSCLLIFPFSLIVPIHLSTNVIVWIVL